MTLSPFHIVFIVIPLIVIALVVTGVVFLVKHLKRRDAERQEMLELMRKQAANRRDDTSS